MARRVAHFRYCLDAKQQVITEKKESPITNFTAPGALVKKNTRNLYNYIYMYLLPSVPSDRFAGQGPCGVGLGGGCWLLVWTRTRNFKSKKTTIMVNRETRNACST